VVAGLVSSADASPVPLCLVEHTIKAAMLIAAHDAAEAGLVSASAAALTEGVLKSMLFAKLKTTVIALVTAGTIAAGAGVYGYQTSQPSPPPAPAVAQEVADDSATQDTDAVASDEREPRAGRVAPAPEPPAPPRARAINRELERNRAESLASIPEKIIELTTASREEQKKGNVTAAAGMVDAIARLAIAWSNALNQLDDDTVRTRIANERALPPDHPLTRPGAYGYAFPSREPSGLPPVRPGTAIPQPRLPQIAPPVPPAETPRLRPPPTDDTDRRLADVEQKLERLLRALEGESGSRANPESATEVPAPNAYFKKPKPAGPNRPKPGPARAEPAALPVPALPPDPPVAPRAPQAPDAPSAPVPRY
jgi:hypothetical protein